MSNFLAVILLAVLVLKVLDRGRPDPGEFDDIEVLDRQFAALARARRDRP